MFRLILLLILIQFQLTAREWENTKGQKIEAELLKYSNGIVFLKRTDGKLFKVPINSLSQKDKEYIAGLLAKQKKKMPLLKDSEVLPVRINKMYGFINIRGKLIIEQSMIEPITFLKA